MTRKFQSQFHLPPGLLGLQGNIRRFADSVNESDITDSVLIEDVELKTGSDNEVGHSLKRPIKGYIVVRSNADSRVFDGTAGIGTSREFFKVRCSADVTVTFLVF